jgi:hypothetical protein
MAELFKGLKNIGRDLAAEGQRQVTQGSMEISSLLFAGHAFVPYGPGQYLPSKEQSLDSNQVEQGQMQQEIEQRER